MKIIFFFLLLLLPLCTSPPTQSDDENAGMVSRDNAGLGNQNISNRKGKLFRLIEGSVSEGVLQSLSELWHKYPIDWADEFGEFGKNMDFQSYLIAIRKVLSKEKIHIDSDIIEIHAILTYGDYLFTDFRNIKTRSFNLFIFRYAIYSLIFDHKILPPYFSIGSMWQLHEEYKATSQINELRKGFDTFLFENDLIISEMPLDVIDRNLPYLEDAFRILKPHMIIDNDLSEKFALAREISNELAGYSAV